MIKQGGQRKDKIILLIQCITFKTEEEINMNRNLVKLEGTCHIEFRLHLCYLVLLVSYAMIF